MIDFYKDLRFGEDGEKVIAKFLQTKGLDFKGTSKELYPDKIKYFDLVFQGKFNEIFVEVKTDKYITDDFDTNNIVFEMSYNNTPSGITTTKSDLWVNYFLNKTVDNIWMIKVDVLRKLISRLKFERDIQITSGGDSNCTRLYILPREKYKEYFKVDTYTGGF